MFDHTEPMVAPTDTVVVQENPVEVAKDAPNETQTPVSVVDHAPTAVLPEPLPEKLDETADWHAEAGRKGARRIAQLIEEGKRYEQEHGLKRGRQRIRQLIEQGKRYEQEHGLQSSQPRKRRQRLNRGERAELLTTLLHCLERLAKPSFRADLGRLVEALEGAKDQAA